MSYSPARLDDQAINSISEVAAEHARIEPIVPSWFTTRPEQVNPDELLNHYRERLARSEAERKVEDDDIARQRRLLDEKIKAAQRIYDQPVEPATPPVAKRAKRPTLPLAELRSQTLRYAVEGKPRRAARPNPIPRLFAYASVAMVVGGSLGFAVANRQILGSFAQSGVAHVRSYLTSLAAPLPEINLPTTATPNKLAASSSGSSTITRKPVASASLEVNDAKGTLNSMIPLALIARSATDGEPVDLMISGLPASAYLTAGHQTPEGSWLIKAPDLANIKLVIPQSEKPTINLEVAAVEQTSGNLAAPAQRMSVELADVKITPASAPPEMQGAATLAQPIPQPIGKLTPVLPGAELVAKADGLMSQGDVVSARQYYLQAANLGNGKAMQGVARTYDPKVYAELKVEGLQPDAAKAADWYKKARAAGISVN